ncbi:assimilatory nitrate reductase catalytic subunit [Herbaspirillum sp. Sphag1AN]|uniref:nitrate reductase n=1 Tax=unclassified Herbaspirillum TaxID=2624150 RepID=UPI001612F2DB|nr:MULTISPECIES: nitrate reductase [unclassified Herbaspirillum]MBB3212174.1 assimilatory nitrate reductase catalytic subunit [Herbaspirillum sp. Sphag1AN]MBB3243992.1 assimilatory nitrate reductase catalytic subunit [Herbaspirillum sp. Sphag64]
MTTAITATAAETASTCPYCGVGCGVRVSVDTQRSTTEQPVVIVRGDPDHPANRGRLCVKGSALGETVDLQGRLLHPQQRQADGSLQQISWDQAIDQVAGGLRRIIDTHGPDAVALYVSGQLLTEDYYIANKLMKGFIGSANIDTNSRLCMSSAVAGYKRAFGEDLVPLCYDDLELADLVVLVGSNTAWCHPILFQRIARAREQRPEMKLVVIDPRRTATCELADLHLPIKAGTDVWLFNGLLHYLAQHGKQDTDFVTQHTNGLEAALAAAQEELDPEQVARHCKIDLQQLLAFYELFAATDKTITAFSMGVNQSSAGTDKVNSIINCHLLSGRIGKPGMGPFSITGQPNAMGGREVGGLANMLAAHMDLDNPLHRETVQTFWDAPQLPQQAGLKALDLFRAVEAGRVKAVWIIATNPMVSLPDADLVQRALENCELVVASDVVQNTDTNAFAHLLLPALAWGEKDGTVTNSERRISRQRPFLPAPGAARADWQILCAVAQRMGYSGFAFETVQAIFDEHARLSSFRNGEPGLAGHSLRQFNLEGLSGLSAEQYAQLPPIQWPVQRQTDGSFSGTERLFETPRYSHPDGRARFIATTARSPMHATDEAYPLVLNTGRVRDQWHTMTRTGKSARLADHVPESFIDMHPQDALLYGVREGSLARISSRWGAMVARVQHSGGIARGNVFVPIHWNAQSASDARVGALVNPVVDPVSGEPEFKHTPVSIEEFGVHWYGFLLTRRTLQLDQITHWTRIQGRDFARYELAGRQKVTDYNSWARTLLEVNDMQADWLDYADRTAGVYRAVHIEEERIVSCLFLSPRPDLPSRAWLASLFDKQQLEEADRVGLLLGQAIEKGADTGPTVCSCFGVGRNTICDAITSKGLQSVKEVTACVKAGGNCGSCVPEIKKLLVESQHREVNTPVHAALASG